MKLLVAALVGVLSLYAETQQERGKRIVDEALKAMGGEKFQNMRNRVEGGRAYSFYREQLRGLAVAKIYTRYADPPKEAPELPSQFERQAFGKDQDVIVLFTNDGKGYTLTYRGAKPLPEDRMLRYNESTLRNVLYIFRMRMHEPGLILQSAGTDIIDNMPVELVDITDSQNRVVRVAFHASTKLPVRQVMEYRDPKTKERFEEVTYFSKWRDVADGIMWPYHMERQRNGEKIYEIFSDSVHVNESLGDELFRLPGSMKVLPPEK
jgi:hypothetical protein